MGTITRLVTRFLTRGIDRLDGLSDEQKRTFVSRAFTWPNTWKRDNTLGGERNHRALVIFVLNVFCFGLALGAPISTLLFFWTSPPTAPMATPWIWYALGIAFGLIPTTGIAIVVEMIAVRVSVRRYLGRLLCTACDYPLRHIAQLDGGLTCPECGHLCNLRSMGLSPEDIKPTQPGPAGWWARLKDWFYFIDAGRYPSLDWKQRQFVRRAARKVKVGLPKSLLGRTLALASLPTVCIVSSMPALALKAVYGDDLPPGSWSHTIAENLAGLATLVMMAVSVCAVAAYWDRWHVHHVLAPGKPLVICTCCGSGLIGEEPEQGRVVCRECGFITVLERQGLREGDLAPAVATALSVARDLAPGQTKG